MIPKRWFLGSITDENAREIEISTDFLEPDTIYEATIYKDGADAHWEGNPIRFEIAKMEVDNSSTIKSDLAPSGGTAVSFIPKKIHNLKNKIIYVRYLCTCLNKLTNNERETSKSGQGASGPLPYRG